MVAFIGREGIANAFNSFGMHLMQGRKTLHNLWYKKRLVNELAKILIAVRIIQDIRLSHPLARTRDCLLDFEIVILLNRSLIFWRKTHRFLPLPNIYN